MLERDQTAGGTPGIFADNFLDFFRENSQASAVDGAVAAAENAQALMRVEAGAIASAEPSLIIAEGHWAIWCNRFRCQLCPAQA